MQLSQYRAHDFGRLGVATVIGTYEVGERQAVEPLHEDDAVVLVDDFDRATPAVPGEKTYADHLVGTVGFEDLQRDVPASLVLSAKDAARCRVGDQAKIAEPPAGDGGVALRLELGRFERHSQPDFGVRPMGLRRKIWRPKRLAARSTSSVALCPPWSRKGLSSTMSTEPTMPLS